MKIKKIENVAVFEKFFDVTVNWKDHIIIIQPFTRLNTMQVYVSTPYLQGQLVSSCV